MIYSLVYSTVLLGEAGYMGTLYYFLKLVLSQNKKLRKKGGDKSGLGGSDRRHSVPPNGFYAISANILPGTVVIFFDPFGSLQGRELR